MEGRKICRAIRNHHNWHWHNRCIITTISWCPEWNTKDPRIYFQVNFSHYLNQPKRPSAFFLPLLVHMQCWLVFVIFCNSASSHSLWEIQCPPYAVCLKKKRKKFLMWLHWTLIGFQEHYRNVPRYKCSKKQKPFSLKIFLNSLNNYALFLKSDLCCQMLSRPNLSFII